MHYKMINLDSIANENNKEYNEKWQFIPDHPYSILIIDGSGSGKTNALLNSIKEQDYVDKIYLYVKDLSKPKYEFLIKRRNMQEQNISMIQILWMTFTRVLMITARTEKGKF